MADLYTISRRDLLRLVGLLQRQPFGVRFDGSLLRVTECHAGEYAVTDVRFRPVERVEPRAAVGDAVDKVDDIVRRIPNALRILGNS